MSVSSSPSSSPSVSISSSPSPTVSSSPSPTVSSSPSSSVSSSPSASMGMTVAGRKVRIRVDTSGTPKTALESINDGTTRTAYQFVSTLATGTKPFSVTSTTMCDNLNADMIDGYHASAFMPLIDFYETGWINRSDWTNVHMGSVDTKNVDSNVAHNLGANLSELIVKVLVSSDGTDNGSFELNQVTIANSDRGYCVDQVDTNNLIIQTGNSGILFINGAGSTVAIDTEDWYYKIKIFKLPLFTPTSSPSSTISSSPSSSLSASPS